MQQNIEEIILKEKSYILISDKNNEYKLTLSVYSNDIFNITALTTKNFLSKKYSLSCTFNDLNKNRFFKIFINVEEIFRELENKIQKSSIIEETNLIYLDIPIGLTVINDILLEIKEIEKSKDDIIEELKNKINTEINNKKINELILKELNENKILLKEEKQKNEDIKKIIDELKLQNNQLKTKVEELIKWKENLSKKEILNNEDINYKIDSKIINKTEQIELLRNRLTNKGFIKNKKVNFNLLYRASRDGDSPQKYHEKCDGKNNTICCIQTIKGCVFGGYTETTIKSDDGIDYKDPNSFVFSLNKMKIYENMKKENDDVCHSEGWGPIFRNDAFAVWNKNFFSYDKHTIGTKSSSNFGIMNEDYEINNGDEYFSIKELEVFQIIIE